MADYLALLGEMAALQPPLFVFGSIAESALLEARLSDSHGDVDVLIPRDELKLRLGQLDSLGFGAFSVYYEPQPGVPLVYGGTREELALELSLLDYDPDGTPYFVVRTEDGAVEITLPRDLFEWPPTIVEEVPIHTLSPLTLVQMRAGATATGVFGPPRPDKDVARQARMVEAFFADADPAVLEPRITFIATEAP